MLAAKQNQNQGLKMPRACPVEPHACSYFSFEREASTAQGRGIQ